MRAHDGMQASARATVAIITNARINAKADGARSVSGSHWRTAGSINGAISGEFTAVNTLWGDASNDVVRSTVESRPFLWIPIGKRASDSRSASRPPTPRSR